MQGKRALFCRELMTKRALVHLIYSKYVLKKYERKRIGIACGEEP